MLPVLLNKFCASRKLSLRADQGRSPSLWQEKSTR